VSFRYSAIKSIQTLAIGISSTTTANGTLGTAVDRNYSVVMITAVVTNSSASDPSLDAVAVQLTSGTNVQASVFTSSGSTRTVYVTVIEFFPHTMKQAVQHVSVSGSTATITAVGAKAALFPGGFTSSVSPGVDDDILGGTELTASTTVTKRGAGTAFCCVADFK
jgi:hypothetical protein